jgi:hypothetical protein
MTAEASRTGTGRRRLWGDVVIGSDLHLLRTCVIVFGISSALLFVGIGLWFDLQEFADGSMFSYAIAAEDVWAFHWHNISDRLLVYLIAELPAEIYVALTGSPRAGVAIYGFLFFACQLVGLAATWAADRSRGRVCFTYACASTGCICPLVFGFPTEMWVAHALFWPTLAVCLYSRGGIAGAVSIFALLLALVLTHEGGLILAAVIVSSLLLSGARNGAFLRAAGALLAALPIWVLVKATLPPDAYDAPMMRRAELHFFDLSIFGSYILVVLFCALAAYVIVFLVLRRLTVANSHMYAAALVSMALIAYWMWIDRSLHADQRYPMRTVLLIATIALGLLAAAYALAADGRLTLPVPLLPRLMSFLARDVAVRAVTGAIVVVMLVHAVEAAKFVNAWTNYKAAVRALAMGTASDPSLGDARFVSSSRIGDDLNRLSWFSTTPYLSILLAPRFAPARLVVDPTSNYFWLSCKTATANENASRSVPRESRTLVRIYACLHR